MELDYEIVSDAPVGARKRKDAKKIPREPAVEGGRERSEAHVEATVAGNGEEVSVSSQREDTARWGGNGVGAQIEVEVEVVKLCPNPRLLIAKYVERGVERLIKVRVGRKRDYFRPRMRLMLERPPDWQERLVAWEYTGKKPRLPGRW